jgi:hypothetical protein
LPSRPHQLDRPPLHQHLVNQVGTRGELVRRPDIVVDDLLVELAEDRPGLPPRPVSRSFGFSTCFRGFASGTGESVIAQAASSLGFSLRTYAVKLVEFLVELFCEATLDVWRSSVSTTTPGPSRCVSSTGRPRATEPGVLERLAGDPRRRRQAPIRIWKTNRPPASP